MWPAAAKETDEEARGKCRGMLEEALATPPLPSAEGAKPLKEVAAGIEDALFLAYDGLSKEVSQQHTLSLHLCTLLTHPHTDTEAHATHIRARTALPSRRDATDSLASTARASGRCS